MTDQEQTETSMEQGDSDQPLDAPNVVPAVSHLEEAGAFYDAHAPLVEKIIRGRLGRKKQDHADELIEDCMAEMVVHVGRYGRDSIRNEAAWVRQVVRNHMADYFEAKRRRNERFLPYREPGTSGSVESSLDAMRSRDPSPDDRLMSDEKFVAMMSRLSADGRLAILYHLAGVKNPVAAAIEGWTPKQLENLRYRARARMKAACRQWAGAEEHDE